MLHHVLSRQFLNVLCRSIANIIIPKFDNAKFNSGALNLWIGVLIKFMAAQIAVSFEYINYFAMQNVLCASFKEINHCDAILHYPSSQF